MKYDRIILDILKSFEFKTINLNKIYVKGLQSVADIFPKSKRCGIYILFFDNESYYIGQTINFVTRFHDHKKNKESFSYVWFQNYKKSDLDILERSIIAEFITNKIPITNIDFTENLKITNDLDLIFDTNNQDKWFKKSNNYNPKFDIRTTYNENLMSSYTNKFNTLKNNIFYNSIKKILRFYIVNCVPFYLDTEKAFWSLSCLPSTNNNSRFICLNINMMEVLVIGKHKKENRVFAFFNMSRNNEILVEDYTENNIEINYNTKGEIWSETGLYKASGECNRICFDNLEDCLFILRNSIKVISDIKHLNLSLMRKGGTIYSKYHSFDLVKDVLEI